MWCGPLSEADRGALAEVPHFLTATTVDDFVAGHEQMRRMFGDLRVGDPQPVRPSDAPAGPDAERPTGQ